MTDEIFRRKLIKLLKTSKIYYTNLSGQFSEYYTEDTKRKMINQKIEEIEWAKHLNNINAGLLVANNIPYIDNDFLLEAENNKLTKIIKTRTLSIDDDSTLEEIAEEISKMCNYEDFEDIERDSELYKLKQAQERGVKHTLNLLKNK